MQSNEILKRYLNINRKIRSLTAIRQLVTIEKSMDLTLKQWNSVETLLFTIKKDLSLKLKTAIKLKDFNDFASQKQMSNIIAETEMKLDKAIKIFDTYVDIITQRQSKVLGKMLGGCDVFAASAMRQKHPFLQFIETPIVSLEGYYGAAVLREGVNFYGYKNLNSLIQIPYSMLVASYLLASVAHEAGHIVMPKLGMDVVFPKMISQIMENAHAPTLIKDLFTFWFKELFADLFAFFCCGKSQSGIRDLLALSDRIVFNIRLDDPHPTNHIRVLLSFEWCRQLWGHGEWDQWEEEWLRLYPIKSSQQKNIKTLEELRQFVPVFSKGMMRATIPHLKVRLIDLFNMTPLAPSNLDIFARDPEKFKYHLKDLTPCHQFAVLRHLYDQNIINGRQCNKLIHKWLYILNKYKSTKFDI
jgi:hypothetical protein